MIPLGTLAPEFFLTDVRTHTLVHFNHQKTAIATVIMFICNHFPYVKHVMDAIILIANQYIAEKVAFFAINSNDISHYPDDSPENMAKIAQDKNFPFPYLFDETQDVAAAYGATCTPDFFVYDNHHRLVYRGQLDDSRPGNAIPVSGQSLRAALDSLLAHTPLSNLQKPSLGCNIKWRT